MHLTIPEAITYATRILVFTTFMASVCYLNTKDFDHKILIWILSTSLLNECTIFFLADTSFPLKTSQSILLSLHQILWLVLISRFWKRRDKQTFLVGIVIFFLMDSLCIEGFESVACYTLVLTSLCYLTIFAAYSTKLLKNENFNAFMADRFILLSAPLLFFFGMSAILGFRSNPLSTTEINGIQLYKIVNITINVTYYPLLLVYIYRQKKAYVI
ncbi:MAG: hypothetical protein EOO50_14935 [Flavobacterium sp.]|uniref:hypothetical protein n=1 Tax=Flavobacterium sp. TaxID=239 RepID=UPI0012186B6A|nr:hypothetical protein [Flavobacterium sp.]RZJ65133.1 MAG: hypothetical protein EOO50_14935 [Flavobacterium sp.]